MTSPRIVAFQEPKDPNVAVARPTMLPTSRGKLVGRDPTMRGLLATIDRVAPSSCTVLVTGESGTGKELLVAALHDKSPRRHRPLVAVNCGAIPDTLIESELFGHVKGAFTGAHATRSGKVALAEGGTLFLDEVGELPLAVQVKLLRLLQQREYSPVGDARAIACDIRIVAATNRDLEAEVAAGRFREDLYYRLNVIHLSIPALRERAADVPLLARHFLRAAAARAGREDLAGFTDAALQALAAHDWPGNVRELENAIERVVLLAPGPSIDAADLSDKIRARRAARPGVTLPAAGLDMRAAVEDFENALIRQALDRTGGNKNRAAALLGLSRTTLLEMLKRKGIHVDRGDARIDAAPLVRAS